MDVFLFDFIVLPLLLIAFLGVVVWSIILFIHCWRARAWKLTIITAVLPVTVLSLAFYPSAIWYYSYPSDYLHLLKNLPQYNRQVEALPHNGKRYLEFNWGGLLFASRGVVYDETDEVARPDGQRSTAWEKRMKNTDLTCGDTHVALMEHLWGHYYVVGFGC